MKVKIIIISEQKAQHSNCINVHERVYGDVFLRIYDLFFFFFSPSFVDCLSPLLDSNGKEYSLSLYPSLSLLVLETKRAFEGKKKGKSVRKGFGSDDSLAHFPSLSLPIMTWTLSPSPFLLFSFTFTVRLLVLFFDTLVLDKQSKGRHQD